MRKIGKKVAPIALHLPRDGRGRIVVNFVAAVCSEARIGKFSLRGARIWWGGRSQWFPTMQKQGQVNIDWQERIDI